MMVGPLSTFQYGSNDGLYVMLAKEGIQPNRIYLKINTFSEFYSVSAGQQCFGNFALQGKNHLGEMRLAIMICFRFHDDALNMSVNGQIYTINSSVFSWVLELCDIDWDAQPNPTFDVYLYDNRIIECVTFLNAVTGLERLDIYIIQPASFR